MVARRFAAGTADGASSGVGDTGDAIAVAVDDDGSSAIANIGWTLGRPHAWQRLPEPVSAPQA